MNSFGIAALRHYEDIGLISSSRRAKNGYRYYSKEILSTILEIQKYKKMEFSLHEIKSFLDIGERNLEPLINDKLNGQLKNIDQQIEKLQTSREEVEIALLATNNFFEGKILVKDQRRVLMETIKSEVLEQLKLKKNVSFKDLEYLKREDYLFDTARETSIY